MIKGNRGKMAIIIMAVVMVVVCSVAGVAIMKKGHAPAKKSSIPEGPTTMVTIGEMVVNLADTDETRYLKTDIVLEVHGKMEAAGGEGEGGGEAANAPLRDAIISVLSSKRFTEINKPGGKDGLKKQIMDSCNERMKEAKVTSVYFNQFAMQ